MDFMSPSNFCNPANPLSPLSPLNPASPLSPMNPMNQSSAPDAPPRPPSYEDKFESFQSDMQHFAKKANLQSSLQLAGKNIDIPGVGSLKQTADGFKLHMVRHSFFGPTRELDYLFHGGAAKTVEVQEKCTRGPVGEFFLGGPTQKSYTLDMKNHSIQ